MQDPVTGSINFEPGEHRALKQVRQVEQERAMSSGVGSAGQFALPIALDPTLLMSDSGVTNPIRRLARTTTISTYVWHGVTSTTPVASFGTEAGTATDSNSPTLAQPSATPAIAKAFVPISFELFDDWVGAQAEEIAASFADSKAVLESAEIPKRKWHRPSQQAFSARTVLAPHRPFARQRARLRMRLATSTRSVRPCRHAGTT